MNEGHPDRAARRARPHGSGRRVGAAVCARPVLPSYQRARLLQPALHGVLRQESRYRRRRRAVSASLSGVDRDRLRPRWPDGRAAHGRRLGDPRRAGGVLRRARGSSDAPRPSAAAALLALNVMEVWFARYPNTEVVMQALLFAALLANARAHVDGDGSSRRWPACCSACCCFCGSTPCSASPPCSRRWRWRRSAGRAARASFFVVCARRRRCARGAVPARPDARVQRSADCLPQPTSPGGSTRCSPAGRRGGSSPLLLARAPAAARAVSNGAPLVARRWRSGRRARSMRSFCASRRQRSRRTTRTRCGRSPTSI